MPKKKQEGARIYGKVTICGKPKKKNIRRVNLSVKSKLKYESGITKFVVLNFLYHLVRSVWDYINKESFFFIYFIILKQLYIIWPHLFCLVLFFFSCFG